MDYASDEIRTERLLLRRARLDDAEAMHRLLSNPVAMRYWSSPPHVELAETERWMASMVDANPAESDDFIVTVDDRLIGKLGAWKLPEVGFLLDPDCWGKAMRAKRWPLSSIDGANVDRTSLLPTSIPATKHR